MGASSITGGLFLKRKISLQPEMQLPLSEVPPTVSKRSRRSKARRKRQDPPNFTALLLLLLVITSTLLAACSTTTPTSAPATSPPTPMLLHMPDIEILPLQGEPPLIDPEATFRITGPQGIPTSELTKLITTTPAVDFAVIQEDGGSYLMKLNNALKPNSLFQVVIAAEQESRSWLFQTKKEFAITATLPNHNAFWVPLDRGIEIYFNQSDLPDIAPYVTITPRVEGYWEQHRSTWVFVPDLLQEDTQYTIKVDGSLSSIAGELLGKDYIFSFRTDILNYQTGKITIAGDYYESFTSSDTPLIELLVWDSAWQQADFTLNVYTLPEPEQLLTILAQHHAHTAGTIAPVSFTGYNVTSFRSDPEPWRDNLLFSVESKIASVIYPDYYWYTPAYLMLPESLAPGWYLVDIYTDGNSEYNLDPTAFQKLIQVSDTMVYLHATYQNLVVWLHDASEGGALEGSEIYLEDELLGQSDADGLALLTIADTADSQAFNWLQIKNTDATSFITPVTLYGANDTPNPSELYYSYLFTDRKAYLPTDTIELWGVVRSRHGTPLPQEATVALQSWRYNSRLQTGEEVNIVEMPVLLNPSGSYHVSLPLDNYISTYYTIALFFPGIEQPVDTTYMQVIDYRKPIYTGTITFEQPTAFSWETVTLNSQITFFEGTPAVDLPLLLNLTSYAPNLYYDQYFFGNTNLAGQYNLDFIPEQLAPTASPWWEATVSSDRVSWQPRTLSAYLRNNAAEDAPFYLHADIPIFATDIMLRAAWDEATTTVKVKSHLLDLTNYQTATHRYGPYDSLAGNPLELPFTLEIHQVNWLKEQVGTLYDFINKVTIPQYKYSTEDLVIKSISGHTSLGTAEISGINYPPSQDCYYYGLVLCQDAQGNVVEERFSIRPEFTRYYVDGGELSYQFAAADYAMEVGATTQISLLENYNPMAAVPGSYLVLQLQSPQGYKGHSLEQGLSFSYTYTADDVPGIFLQGAYWNGSRIFPVNHTYIGFASNERRLALALNTDQASYLPGDTVTVDLAVTDREGNPQRADLYLCAVDEAALAIAPHEANILQGIYRYLNSPLTWRYASYVQHSLFPGSMAEKGGDGGGANPRRDFRDAAIAVMLATDASGQASYSFTLPDNLTTWRLTAIAVTPETADFILAGESNLEIAATLPFFVDVILGDSYLLGDDLAVTLRAFGSELNSNRGAHVQLTCQVQDITGEVWQQQLSIAPGAYGNINFGPMPAGEYVVTAIAEYGAYRDMVELPVSILGSVAELPLTKELDLNSTWDLEVLREPVSLYFYDKNLQMQMRSASHLLRQQGMRADQRVGLAQALAWQRAMLDSSTVPAKLPINREGVGNIQHYEGGVRLLPDAAPDPILTAKVIMAAPDYLDLYSAADYLTSILSNVDSPSEHVVAALMGLAALREPVLVDTYALLQDTASLTLKEQVYLIIAAAELGDISLAQKHYQRLVTPLVAELPPWKYLPSGYTSTDDLELTALVLLAALHVDKVNAPGFLAYLLDHHSPEALTNLEIMAFLTRYLPEIPETTSFSYLLNGVTQEVVLDKRHLHQEELTSQQLALANVQLLTGELGISASYTGSLAEASLPEEHRLAQVTKTITPMRGNILEQSALQRVTITANMDPEIFQGGFFLTDYIPSGMRFVSVSTDLYGYDANNRYGWSLLQQEGQKVVFYGYAAEIVINYYVNAVLPGRFVLESTYLQSITTDAWGASARGEIIIRGK